MNSRTTTTINSLRVLAATLLLCLAIFTGLRAFADDNSSDSSGPSGSPDSSAGSSGLFGLLQDSNKVTPLDIRTNYFKRYPFAAAAGPSTLGGCDVLQNHYESTTNIFGDPGNDQNNIQESAQGGFGVVEAYSFVLKFCNDDPTKGICYFQPPLIAFDQPASMRDNELFLTALSGVNGLPLSDTQFQIIDRENKQRFLELLYDPERFIWLATNTGQMQWASCANSTAGLAETVFDNARSEMQNQVPNPGTSSGGGGGGGGGGAAGAGGGTYNISQAIALVQQMYRNMFLPMAYLLLLPGAVLTQVKGLVSSTILGDQGEDSMSPVTGIMRSLIAVFLIPATAVIVSYSIDIGNSLQYSVVSGGWIHNSKMQSYGHEQTYNPPMSNAVNAILPPVQADGFRGDNGPSGGGGGSSSGVPTPGGGTQGAGGSISSFQNSFLGGALSSFIPGIGGALNTLSNAQNAFNSLSNAFSNPMNFISGANGQGKAAQIPEESTKQEDNLWLSQVLQAAFNGMMMATSSILMVLCALQVVLMCYLYLMGPVAASFFAWPVLGGKLFKGVFGNWLNAVIQLSLWRFYWCVILAIMSIYIDSVTNVNAEREMMVFTCFLGMLTYVPFHPFDFDPGEASTQVLSKAGQAGSKESGMPQAASRAMQAAGASPQQIAKVEGILTGATKQQSTVAQHMGYAVDPRTGGILTPSAGGGGPVDLGHQPPPGAAPTPGSGRTQTPEGNGPGGSVPTAGGPVSPPPVSPPTTGSGAPASANPVSGLTGAPVAVTGPGGPPMTIAGAPSSHGAGPGASPGSLVVNGSLPQHHLAQGVNSMHNLAQNLNVSVASAPTSGTPHGGGSPGTGGSSPGPILAGGPTAAGPTGSSSGPAASEPPPAAKPPTAPPDPGSPPTTSPPNIDPPTPPGVA